MTTPDRRDGCDDGSHSDSLVSLECFLDTATRDQWYLIVAIKLNVSVVNNLAPVD